MMRILFICLLSVCIDTPSASAADTTRPYSAWMAESVIDRGQAMMPPGPKASSSTYLQVGFFQTAVLRLLEYYHTPEPISSQSRLHDYLADSTHSVVPFLLNATQDTQIPLDRFSTGKSLLHQYEETHNATLKVTLDTLRESINLQPRNIIGGYWYFVYPQWSYLDGMYSVIPFLSYYTTALAADNSSAVADDIMKQLDLLWTHCRQNSTGLLVHGYDASKKAVWANSVTGASPYVWSRSMGWYLMALVDTLELETPNLPLKLRTYLQRRLVRLSDAVISAADAQTGCWWQLMTFPGRPGNYIESSGSAMFTYALYKAARLGYLPKRLAAKSTDTASKCYRHIVDAFVVQNSNGTLGYNGTVAVCSLNSTASYEVCGTTLMGRAPLFYE
ncbi:Unsaturated rhamnogalacturonyl hydrolase YteR [Penicillium subrubescens]|uniref:Unsaturated rhamnogalacturonyl hydrolase YteR n=1 Tax=Penicillium subrubescens TaxID=1316194 RepID=A0A1Q5TK57_9EURO|nr:Unsaturated rhamnogalacturonyl hydrolase YteR [Penicillium subrubescens]